MMMVLTDSGNGNRLLSLNRNSQYLLYVKTIIKMKKKNQLAIMQLSKLQNYKSKLANQLAENRESYSGNRTSIIVASEEYITITLQEGGKYE